ncbi:hypothetical protein F4778DRAFT_790802 [Xylariomycetidae sp. FL2044]|nr:hypothetical protein F4778DRAFT_790802 [Xylariomycetidae sp. FL2044]
MLAPFMLEGGPSALSDRHDDADLLLAAYQLPIYPDTNDKREELKHAWTDIEGYFEEEVEEEEEEKEPVWILGAGTYRYQNGSESLVSGEGQTLEESAGDDDDSITPDDSVSLRGKDLFPNKSGGEPQSSTSLSIAPGFPSRNLQQSNTLPGLIDNEISGLRQTTSNPTGTTADGGYTDNSSWPGTSRCFATHTYQEPILNDDGLYPSVTDDPTRFRNRYFEVKESAVAGLGAFALQDLEPFQVVLMERPLMYGDTSTVIETLDKLTEPQRAAFSTLAAYTPSTNDDRRHAIFKTNCFSTSQTGPGQCLCLVGARFNHGCTPACNVKYAYDKQARCMVFETLRHVEAGQELKISYSPHTRNLYLSWGFRCKCGACRPLTDEDCAALDNDQQW